MIPGQKRANTPEFRCSICGAKLQRPARGRNLIPWWDCGGDCTTCMAHAGDPDCIRLMREWLLEVER